MKNSYLFIDGVLLGNVQWNIDFLFLLYLLRQMGLKDPFLTQRIILR